MLIYIVRHGQTMANKERILQGWKDYPLIENGRDAAAVAGQKMRDIRFDECISSPLMRAKETAQIILRESGNDIGIIEDARLKEMNFGDYEMTSLDTTYELKQFFEDPLSCDPFPNGENVRMVMKRTQEFLRELIARDDGKTYLVATHGCALRAMLNFLYEDKNDYWHGQVPPNCCVNIIEAVGGKAKLIAEDMVW
ncbi:MAG: histidine phosphatase family protein [Lachnospiraceae bacterium]|nr:histidine phosphatase family protein [Lachnospiraceae bacterium]